MIVKVTQEHIDKGIRGDIGACPIALALIEALPGNTIHVSMIDAHIEQSVVDFPTEAKEFIINFDEGEKDPKWLEPFEFELDYEVEEKE